jgi:hypothetical protein
MPGLDPGIQEMSKPRQVALDRRVKPGDDNKGESFSSSSLHPDTCDTAGDDGSPASP